MLFVGFSGSVAHAAQTLTVDFSNAPQGTHFVEGTPAPTCTVSTLTVICPELSFELAGVGNTNATATLVATYEATVNCRNHGGHIVEVHAQLTTVSSTTGTISPDNGRLTVNAVTSTAPTGAEFQALATCPNPNWTAEVIPESITLVSFVYTVTFVGFTEPAILIEGNDP